MTEWKRRRADETKRMIEFFDITSTADSRGSGLMSVDDSLFSPPFGKETIGEAFRVCGCEVVASIGEADKNIARICHTRKCLGVMSGDSDFFAFRVPLLIKGDSVRFSEGEIFATCYELNKVASLLGVKPEFLPL